MGSWKLEEDLPPGGLPQFLRELAQALESGRGDGGLTGLPADLRKLVLVAEQKSGGLAVKLKAKRSGEVRVQKKSGVPMSKPAQPARGAQSGSAAKGADAAARAKDKYRQLKKAMQADYKALERAAQDGLMPAQDLVESFLALCASMADMAPPLKDQGGAAATELAKANSAFVEAASTLRRAVSSRDASALAEVLAGLERRRSACHAQFK